jgi:hypothetical protein
MSDELRQIWHAALWAIGLVIGFSIGGAALGRLGIQQGVHISTGGGGQ